MIRVATKGTLGDMGTAFVTLKFPRGIASTVSRNSSRLAAMSAINIPPVSVPIWVCFEDRCSNLVINRISLHVIINALAG